jgi:double-stranded uracil-DNA glycosylase
MPRRKVRLRGDPAAPSSGFEPIAGTNARVLILGSLPGRVSLQMHQYYAQPYNAFWPIMGRLLCFDPAMPYDRRVAKLIKCRIAVWDVCASAVRTGSLDSAIVNTSVRPNDFVAFLARYKNVTTVYFNGSKAAVLYRNLVMPRLPPKHQQLKYVALPSTSPAHAVLTLADKFRRWSTVLIASET